MESEKDKVWRLVKDDEGVTEMIKDTRDRIEAFTKKNRGKGDDDDDEDDPHIKGRKDRRGTLVRQHSYLKKMAAQMSEKALGKKKKARMASLLGCSKKVDRKTLVRTMCGPVIDPDSKFRAYWNVALAILIVYCGIQVPLELAFEQDMVDAMCGVGEKRQLRADCMDFQVWFWFNLMIDMWFIADIIVNCRTGFYVEGHLVKEDIEVLKNYLKNSFVIDALGSFPINLVLIGVTGELYGETQQEGDSEDGTDVGRVNRLLRMLRMTKLAKLARMFKLAKYIEGAEAVINPGILAVFKLVMISLLCCHWFGCMWWLISDLELSEPSLMGPVPLSENIWHPEPWLKQTNDLGTKYMQSFFWGAGMVTSLVPKDVEPATALESLVTK